MPYTFRLMQAIHDEEANLRQKQVFHIIGPGLVVLLLWLFAGEMTVRVLNAPDLFGIGMLDVLCYGLLWTSVLLGLSKGYSLDKWLEGWLFLTAEHKRRVAKIEAVIVNLGNTEQSKTAAAVQSNARSSEDDPWMRALQTSVPAPERECP